MKKLGYLRVERFKLQPGQEWIDELSTWKLIRVAKGTCYWIGGEGSLILDPGEVLVLTPAAKGSLLASQVGDVSLQAFAFDPSLLCGFFTLAERHVFMTTSSHLPPAIVLPPSHEVADKFETLVMFGAGRGPISRRAEALAVVATLFDDLFHQAQEPCTRTASALERFQQLISRLPDLELVRLSPMHLASLCGCSPGHFNRMFKRHFGVPARARRAAFRQLRAVALS